MAANEYYTSHPQSTTHPYPAVQYHTTVPPDFPTSPNPTSYEPYRQNAHHQHHPQYPFSLSSTTSACAPSSNERSLLHPSNPSLKKSKSDRALKFVEKQVKKQIDKKLHSKQSQQQQQHDAEGHVIEASQGDSSGTAGGEYGYGDAGSGYGPVEGFGESAGNFEWEGVGEGGSGIFDALGGLEIDG